MSLPIYVDIDGTLTSEDVANGPPLQRRIDRVRLWIRDGKQVVVWSARGTEYAREFCRRHSLTPMAVLGKPNFCVDDKPTIRSGGLRVEEPTFLDS
jgi:hydroxymethylpyrimidine pyrophosphatase-like HAD family hydrolase